MNTSQIVTTLAGAGFGGYIGYESARAGKETAGVVTGVIAGSISAMLLGLMIGGLSAVITESAEAVSPRYMK